MSRGASTGIRKRAGNCSYELLSVVAILFTMMDGGAGVSIYYTSLGPAERILKLGEVTVELTDGFLLN
jgi:hypothetical protein